MGCGQLLETHLSLFTLTTIYWEWTVAQWNPPLILEEEKVLNFGEGQEKLKGADPSEGHRKDRYVSPLD